jgi:hypothetical protein
MSKADTLALATLLAGPDVDATLLEHFYRDVVWEFGQAELLVQTTLIQVAAGTAEFQLPELGVRLLTVFYEDEELGPLRLTDVAALDPFWRDARGHPLAYIVDDVSARGFRLYPVPEISTNLDTEAGHVVMYYTEAPDDVLVWLELPIALTILAREYVRESDHRDPVFAASCQNMATALMSLGLS